MGVIALPTPRPCLAPIVTNVGQESRGDATRPSPGAMARSGASVSEGELSWRVEYGRRAAKGFTGIGDDGKRARIVVGIGRHGYKDRPFFGKDADFTRGLRRKWRCGLLRTIWPVTGLFRDRLRYWVVVCRTVWSVAGADVVRMAAVRVGDVIAARGHRPIGRKQFRPKNHCDDSGERVNG